MYYASKWNCLMSRIKIFYSLLFFIQPLLFSGCFIDKEIDCRMLFMMTIMNSTDDTITVVPGRNNGASSDVESFSFMEAIVAPLSAVTLEVDYRWTGTNNCSVICDDEDYNGDLFKMSFIKGDSLIEKRRIVPCKPCDKPADGIVTICKGCVAEFADTIYYGR